MKKLTIAVACVAFAVAVAYFACSTRQNSYFGYTDEVYAAFGQNLRFIDGEDLLELIYCGASVSPTNSKFYIQSKDETSSYIMSGNIWVDSRISSIEDSELKRGCVEQYRNGKRTSVYSIGWVGSHYPDAVKFFVDGGKGYQNYYVPMPALIDKSIVTLFYREGVIDEMGNIDSVGDIKSSSFEWKSRPHTNKPFDVMEVSFFKETGNPDVLWIRKNGDLELPYLDISTMFYERLIDGEWVRCISGYNYHSESEARFDSGVRYNDYGEAFTDTAGYRIWAGQLSPGDYRLNAIFYENPDGTGEQYTLTLNLRFDE